MEQISALFPHLGLEPPQASGRPEVLAPVNWKVGINNIITEHNYFSMHLITADEIPRQFAQWGQEFSWIHCMIEKGTYLRCRLIRSLHPSKLFVQLVETDEEARAFYQQLQSWVSQALMRNRQPIYVPKAACILPGLYVLCRYAFIWYRARVVSMVENGKVKVELIDSGIQKRVDIQDLSYILPDMMTALKPQAIQCRLRFGRPFDSYVSKMIKRGEVWDPAANAELMTHLRRNQLGITFHKFKVQTNYDNGVESGVWTVSVNCLVPGDFELKKITPKETAMEVDEEPMDSHMEVDEAIEPESTVAHHPDVGSLVDQVMLYDISTLLAKYIPIPT